jgi:hypothetical protein
MARIAPSHTAAASSNDIPGGFDAIGAFSRTHRYSAWAPNLSVFTPKTWSPTANVVTAGPASATTPANSLPRIVRFGRRSPAKSRMNQGDGARKPQSVRFTVVACTSTSTSSSAGSGRSMSAIRKTSGPPYSALTTARIGSLPLLGAQSISVQPCATHRSTRQETGHDETRPPATEMAP